jgi:hypothetical protein
VLLAALWVSSGVVACSPAALSIGVENGGGTEAGESDSESGTSETDSAGGAEVDPCIELTEPPCENPEVDYQCMPVYAHELILHGDGDDAGYCQSAAVFLGCISADSDCAQELSYWCSGESFYETELACQPPGAEACEAPGPIVGPCP